MRRLLFMLLACCCGLAQAQDIAAGDLPPEGRETLTLIYRGGSFPYARDGKPFGNFEKRLPLQRRGYYREYTVATPGIKHRGARRIVCGGERPRQPDTCYYSADHYRSFREIIQ